jgi:tetratricopeptide (TPR) repeat protein
MVGRGKNMLQHIRLQNVLVLMGLLGVLGWALAQEDVTSSEPPLEKDAAIARVEELKGSVSIDGDAPGQPVWRVDFSDVPVNAAALLLLKAFPQLETLSFDRTPLNDELLQPIGEIRTLRELSLADTRITDEGLKHLAKLENLQRINLSGTKVSNEGLQHLVPLLKLTDIQFEGSGITALGIDLLVDGQHRYKPPAEESQTPVETPVNSDPARRFNDMGRLILLGADRKRETFERGVEYLERAVIASPDNDQYKLDLADAYAVLNDDLTLAAALDLYEDVETRRPDDEQLLGQIARAYSALGNLEQAQEAVERRLLLAPADGVFDAATQIVGIVAADGDRDWAIQQLRTATRKVPSDRRLQLLLAGLLAETQQQAEARKIVERIRQETAADHPLREAADELLASLGDVR